MVFSTWNLLVAFIVKIFDCEFIKTFQIKKRVLKNKYRDIFISFDNKCLYVSSYTISGYTKPKIDCLNIYKVDDDNYNWMFNNTHSNIKKIIENSNYRKKIDMYLCRNLQIYTNVGSHSGYLKRVGSCLPNFLGFYENIMIDREKDKDKDKEKIQIEPSAPNLPIAMILNDDDNKNCTNLQIASVV